MKQITEKKFEWVVDYMVEYMSEDRVCPSDYKMQNYSECNSNVLTMHCNDCRKQAIINYLETGD